MMKQQCLINGWYTKWEMRCMRCEEGFRKVQCCDILRRLARHQPAFVAQYPGTFGMIELLESGVLDINLYLDPFIHLPPQDYEVNI